MISRSACSQGEGDSRGLTRLPSTQTRVLLTAVCPPGEVQSCSDGMQARADVQVSLTVAKISGMCNSEASLAGAGLSASDLPAAGEGAPQGLQTAAPGRVSCQVQGGHPRATELAGTLLDAYQLAGRLLPAVPGFRPVHAARQDTTALPLQLFAHQPTVGPAALYGDEVVGAIGTRLERQTTDAAPQQRSKLYIMTLGVLAPFRGHGIGVRCQAASCGTCS